MTTAPIQPSSSVSQSQQVHATPAKATTKQASALPQDTVTLNSSSKVKAEPAPAKDQPVNASSSRTSTADADHDGH